MNERINGSAAKLPIVVVGSGIAGLSAALAAAPHPVVLLGRAQRGPGCATALAQGGIAAAMADGDTPAAHARDTHEAGSHHNDPASVEALTQAAPDAIAWLQQQGVCFDRDGDHLQLGREGGHGCHRIVHAGGDASGAKVLAALSAAAEQAGHIDWRPPCEVDGVWLSDGRVTAVQLRMADGSTQRQACSALVLATGGIGALFAATTNPPGADGNGLALAAAIGAVLRDVEFVQFHPTAMAVQAEGSLPLITEALRGAGARLLDDDGHPIMEGVHPLRDLAPRDVVARCVWATLQRGSRVWLDSPALASDWTGHFPTVHALCLEHGIDPVTSPIPVTPAAHFHMGGIAVDLDGRSTVPGLYAVGEVACTGVHGANRLASNSLLEGVVFGRRLGARLATLPDPRSSNAVHEHYVARGATVDAAALARLRELTWRSLGPVRSQADMSAALEEIEADGAFKTSWQGRLVATMLRCARQRTQSLGAHFLDEHDHAGTGVRELEEHATA